MLSASWFARPRIEWTSWATIFICCVAVFYAPLRFHTSVFAVGLEDDFFYYAKAAHNLAFHGVSTFDGVHPTNGYHPLWMLVLTGLSRFFDPGGVFHARTIYPLRNCFADSSDPCRSADLAHFAPVSSSILRGCSKRMHSTVDHFLGRRDGANRNGGGSHRVLDAVVTLVSPTPNVSMVTRFLPVIWSSGRHDDSFQVGYHSFCLYIVRS